MLHHSEKSSFTKLREGDFSEEQFVFQRKQDHGNTFKLQDLYSEKDFRIENR